MRKIEKEREREWVRDDDEWNQVRFECDQIKTDDHCLLTTTDIAVKKLVLKKWSSVIIFKLFV